MDRRQESAGLCRRGFIRKFLEILAPNRTNRTLPKVFHMRDLQGKTFRILLLVLLGFDYKALFASLERNEKSSVRSVRNFAFQPLSARESAEARVHKTCRSPQIDECGLLIRQIEVKNGRETD